MINISKYYSKKSGSESGFSLIEIILAVSILSIMGLFLIWPILSGLDQNKSNSKRSQALTLANEEIEALKNIRDNNFLILSEGSYGIAKSNGSWILTGN